MVVRLIQGVLVRSRVSDKCKILGRAVLAPRVEAGGQQKLAAKHWRDAPLGAQALERLHRLKLMG